jgi:nucleoid-associated protein YgaU
MTHYGTKKSAVVRALFDANRDRLSSPDAVRAGMELALPVLTKEQDSSIKAESPTLSEAVTKPDRAAAEATGRSTPATRSGSGAANLEDGWRWYQVKKNDRYMSIAREQLGDASRWKEIHELNKDRFPDAGKIREGVRIKIPQSSRRKPVGA